MRPNRNRISRLVAAEMRYFHRPLFLALLSCFTVIVLILAILFSMLSYVTSASAENDWLYLNISVAMFILYAASYLVHRIIRWRRSPSYSLTMSFTSISFIFSAAASFLLTRAAWLDSLNNAMVGGFQIYIRNLLRWSFWAPAAVLLFYFISIFIKAKSANRGGGWLFLLFPLIPPVVVALLWLAMYFVVEKEDVIPNTSIATSIYLSIMLMLAVRYAVKAILNYVLYHMRTTEDTVLVRNILREHDGKWVQWWERKPEPIETMDSTDRALPAENEIPAIESTPISDVAPAAIDAGIAKYQVNLPGTTSAKTKKAKVRKESKIRALRPKKQPRYTLRDLIILALAAIRRPALSVSLVPPEITETHAPTAENDALAASAPPEEAVHASAPQDAATETGAAPDHVTAETDAAPAETTKASKIKLLLARAVAYLKKPYSPPVQIQPAKQTKRRARLLSSLAAALNAVAAQLRASGKDVTETSSEASPPADAPISSERQIWRLPKKK